MPHHYTRLCYAENRTEAASFKVAKFFFKGFKGEKKIPGGMTPPKKKKKKKKKNEQERTDRKKNTVNEKSVKKYLFAMNI